ncbi:transcriptional repressor LexA [Weissella halotolerans]|uniref:LexA repressor n=1 Tax=Weissella halotolerans DSM 20190 TaxID=1123500 RepID=A0A0R2FY71_9LACO|nr:transcriptional repressor LexA [Weissella halotolerans]KRN33353.1 LexA repressor [Weissella halotolerans DSM 20190]
MTNKSTKQLEILRFIYRTEQKNGYPPTVREIGQAVNLSSTSTVHGHLSRLQKKGYLHKDPAKPRSLSVTTSGQEALGLNQAPLLMLNPQDDLALNPSAEPTFLPVPEQLIPKNDHLFMFQQPNANMQDSGILAGDYLIVYQQDTATNGDLVIVRPPEQPTQALRFFHEADHIRLQAEHAGQAPFIVGDISILGRVIGLYRNQL